MMVQHLLLTQVKYTQLNSMTWYATAEVEKSLCLSFQPLLNDALRLPFYHLSHVTIPQFDSHNWQSYISKDNFSSHQLSRNIAHNQRQIQRAGVRLLLQQLLNKLEISDTLDESDFPYRLVNHKHYVCFSHTGMSGKSNTGKHSNQVNQNMKNKIAVVISLDRPAGIDIEHNNVVWKVAKRFYSDNEINRLLALPTVERDTVVKLLWQLKECFIKINHYTLAQGMGMDYSHLIADILGGTRQESPIHIIADDKTDYHIAMSTTQHMVVVF